jgi:hypothetical protein
VFEILQAAATTLLAGVMLDSQLKTIVVLLAGLLKGEQAGIAAIGARMPGEATDKSKKNRVFRFVSNPRIPIESICNAIIGGLGMLGKRVIVATDWTEIGPLSVLTSAVVIDGRAIPIFWTVIDTLRTRKKAVEVEHMRRLSCSLVGIHAVHVLDRGFDNGDFLKAIGSFCKYVVRVSRDFDYRKRGDKEFKKMQDFSIKRGRRHDLGEIQYTAKHKTRCRLVAFYDHRQKEAWLLATNRFGDERAVIIELYSRRFQIEESFKDLKDLRNGFGLHGYRMEKPDHLSRLLAVVAIGYLLVNAGGHYGEEIGMHRRMQSNTRQERELAAWRVGLRLIQDDGLSVPVLVERLSMLVTHWETTLGRTEDYVNAAA